MASIRCNHRRSSHLLAGVLALVGLVLLSASPGWCVSVHPGWPQSVGQALGSLAIGDIDGDGQLEVVAPCADGTIYAWHPDGTLVAGWPVNAGFSVNGVTLGDMDGDGRPEVLAAGTTTGNPWYGEVCAFHGDGTLVTGWPQAMPNYSTTVGVPALGDIDGDGEPEVVVSDMGYGRVYAWHRDGTPVAGWPVPVQSAGLPGGPSVPALGDIDGDGCLEVLVGSESGKVYAWHGDGTPVAGWPVTYEKGAEGSTLDSKTPALGDLDGDGQLDVVVEVDFCRVYAWHGDGTPVTGWPQGPVNNTNTHFLDSQVVLGDLDGDGRLEVVAACVDVNTADQCKIYAWHGDGTPVAGWPSDLYAGDPKGACALGDLDGDGRPEVVACVGNNLVYALDGDGTLMAGWPQTVASAPPAGAKRAESSVAPYQCTLADLEGDGYLEVVQPTTYSSQTTAVTIWTCDALTGDRLPWPMFQHDARHTGCYTGYPALSSGSVTPQSGDTATQFTWRVTYSHTGNVPPTSVWVGIWCAATGTTSWRTMSALDPSDTNYLDGKWYTYSAALPAGSHAYRFAAQAGGQWIYWPQPAGTYQSGPAAAPVNSVVLSSGYVTPTSGTNATNFTWRIKYWNTGNAMPDEVDVAIWFPTLKTSYWYRMWAYDPSDTNCVDGKWYTFSRKWLPAGAYSYRFAARQGTNWTYWPSPAGTYSSGPAVGP